MLEARMRNYAAPFLDIGARAAASCLDAEMFLAKVLARVPFEEPCG